MYSQWLEFMLYSTSEVVKESIFYELIWVRNPNFFEVKDEEILKLFKLTIFHYFFLFSNFSNSSRGADTTVIILQHDTRNGNENGLIEHEKMSCI